MIVFGLTGSIGMGKSTAARMMGQMGAGVHNADEAVHKALQPNGASFEEVALTFPEAWDKKRHIIHRHILGEIVFDDPVRKQELEFILHPIVQATEMRFIRAQRRMGRKAVVLDIPLLFETGADKRVDVTITVSAPYDVQRRRVLSRPGMSEERFHAILDSQMSDGEKCLRADYTVPTHMGLATTYGLLRSVYKEHV